MVYPYCFLTKTKPFQKNKAKNTTTSCKQVNDFQNALKVILNNSAKHFIPKTNINHKKKQTRSLVQFLVLIQKIHSYIYHY